MPRLGEAGMALSLALVAIAAGYALYSYLGPAYAARGATSPVAQYTAAHQEWTAIQIAPIGEPLRVANPFDPTEIFEFPAGTSEADAREAIAGFLIERATRRSSGS